MSSLARRAKPVLGPMIQGEPRTLFIEDQTTIATWMTLKALSFDLFDAPFIEPEAFRAFYEEQQPPPLFQAWLGEYAADSPRFMRINTPIHYAHPYGTLLAGSQHVNSSPLFPIG